MLPTGEGEQNTSNGVQAELVLIPVFIALGPPLCLPSTCAIEEIT
jgi:hypothetical protein